MDLDLDSLHAFARLYTAAWCSQNPAAVAAFFEFDGSLQVNDGPAAVGRPAIADVARGFMTDFPDLEVRFDELTTAGQNRAVYYWTLEGTHAATGCPVRISGFEQWTFGQDGLIAESKGLFDSLEYQRQLGVDA